MNPSDALPVLSVFVPLAAAGLVPVVGRLSGRARNGFAVGAGGLTAGLTLVTLMTLRHDPVEVFAWIPLLGIGLSIRVDALSGVIAAIAGTIGCLVIVYSLGYMRQAEREGYTLSRYYALVLLFIGSMIGLAFADTLLAFYIFWEVVGLCSFALISFYHRDPNARRAGLKAFAITRVGDIGLLIAVVALWSAGAVTFSELLRSSLPRDILAIAGVGVLLAAFGKSAQVPFHVWLPDAMEAPTPISALIHAATMVNAGVYLVVRTYPTFAAFGWWPDTLLAVGAGTALLAAILAYLEQDIKRVLAYSTVSQLGYMMAAVGSGALVAGTFHLYSQAIFKALLFLAAGAVIQAVGSRDLHAMGGLRRLMPITSRAFLVGVLALVGIPLFIGFWSKELLLDSLFAEGRTVPLVVLVVTSLVTAGYALRAYALAFLGTAGASSARDPPRTMVSVLTLLAVAATVGGFVLGPFSAAMTATLPAYPIAAVGIVDALANIGTSVLFLVLIAVAVLSVALLRSFGRSLPKPLSDASAVAQLLRRGITIDAMYGRIAGAISSFAARVRQTQTGDLNLNVAAMMGALVVIVVVLLWGVVG